jgi:hypothetical protein
MREKRVTRRPRIRSAPPSANLLDRHVRDLLSLTHSSYAPVGPCSLARGRSRIYTIDELYLEIMSLYCTGYMALLVTY